MACPKKFYFNLFDWLSALRTSAQALMDVIVRSMSTSKKKNAYRTLGIFEQLENRAMLACWGQVNQAGDFVAANGNFTDTAYWWSGSPPGGGFPGSLAPLAAHRRRKIR